MELFKTGPVPVAWFCIDMVAVDDIDFTAYAVLRQVFQQANAHDSRLVFSEVSDFVFAELERSGIVDLAGRDAFFSESIDVIETYRKNAGSSIPDGLIT